MSKRMAAIAAIYILVGLAWIVLGGSVTQRTWSADRRLKSEVSALWGSSQTQVSPQLTFVWDEVVEDKQTVEDPATGVRKVLTKLTKVERQRPVILDRSKVDVDLMLDHRRKGLLWYSTYVVDFAGQYGYVHDDGDGRLVIAYAFPTPQALYDNFRFEIDGREDPRIVPVDEAGTRVVRQVVPVQRGTRVPFAIAYRSQGLDWWRYSFGSDVNRVKNFDLTMTTDFDAVDFPEGTMSPGTKEKVPGGWRLSWRSENLISGYQIGMELPRKLNPGPLAAKISFFAPVCLGFFFVWMFVICLMRGIELHPMNYLFLAAAFFAFDLLFAYSVDHIDIVPAFLISSAVSIFLVVSYLRLVVGIRFAALEAGVSQLVYLVLFSYAHFFEGFTGLIVTIGSILTLFLLMQLTGRIRWSERLRGAGSVAARGA
jgi:inner membrane protein involved in colicin E2 resistance